MPTASLMFNIRTGITFDIKRLCSRTEIQLYYITFYDFVNGSGKIFCPGRKVFRGKKDYYVVFAASSAANIRQHTPKTAYTENNAAVVIYSHAS